VEITRKTQLYGGIGLGLVLVLVLFKMLVLKGSAPVTAPPPIVHRTLPNHTTTPRHTTTHSAKVAVHPAPAVKIDPTLPAPLRLALRHHRVVVAVLYAPGDPVDAAAVLSALLGATAAHAGFAALNVRNESIAEAIATKLPGSADPSVFIVRRPGDIKFLVDGYIDGAVVAQAARNSR